MPDAERSGGCLCGAVRIKARGAPLRAPVCHCRTCQKNTGAAFLAALVFPGDRVEITGELKSFRAPEIERCFCEKCGSLICLVHPGQEARILMTGCFDEPPPFAPEYELFIGRRQPWLPAFPGTVRYEGYRDGKPAAAT